MQSRRDSALASLVDAPGSDRAILLQSQVEGTAGGNRRHSTQARRNIRLTVVVAAPSHHRSIVLERQNMGQAELNALYIA